MNYTREDSLGGLAQGYIAIQPLYLEDLAAQCECTVDEIEPIVKRLRGKGIFSINELGQVTLSERSSLAPPEFTWWQRAAMFFLGGPLEPLEECQGCGVAFKKSAVYEGRCSECRKFGC